MTPAELRAWVADSRACQGLGPTITDPTAQDQLAAMAADAMTRQNGDGADEQAEAGRVVTDRGG